MSTLGVERMVRCEKCKLEQEQLWIIDDSELPAERWWTCDNCGHGHDIVLELPDQQERNLPCESERV